MIRDMVRAPGLTQECQEHRIHDAAGGATVIGHLLGTGAAEQRYQHHGDSPAGRPHRRAGTKVAHIVQIDSLPERLDNLP